MNKVAVKFTAIDYYTGKRKTVKHTYETDKLFVDKQGVLKLQDGQEIPYTNSALDQADEYVETIDKRLFMEQNDIMTILNWKVTYYTGMPVSEKKANKKTVSDESTQILQWLKDANVSVDMIPDIAAAYSEMGDYLKKTKLSIGEKALLLMRIVVVGTKAHVEGMNQVLGIIGGKSQDKGRAIEEGFSEHTIIK